MLALVSICKVFSSVFCNLCKINKKNKNSKKKKKKKKKKKVSKWSWRNIYLGKNEIKTGEFRYSITITNSPLVA